MPDKKGGHIRLGLIQNRETVNSKDFPRVKLHPLFVPAVPPEGGGHSRSVHVAVLVRFFQDRVNPATTSHTVYFIAFTNKHCFTINQRPYYHRKILKNYKTGGPFQDHYCQFCLSTFKEFQPSRNYLPTFVSGSSVEYSVYKRHMPR